MTNVHQFAQADAETPRGRFTQVDAATGVGANPVTNYPAAAAHQRDPVPPENPLGYAIDALEPAGPDEAQATDGPVDPSAPLDVERAGPSLSSDDPAGVHVPSPPGTSRDVNAGSSPSRTYRRF